MLAPCLDSVERIPRQACLGLIEARGVPQTLPFRPVVFRGKLASASLKHHLLRVQAGRLLRGIPRQACLGLIEAGRWGARAGTKFFRVFRGKLASASLKRRWRRGARCGWRRVFRGKLASASLKLGDPLKPWGCGSRYSEASLPRPH